MGGSRKGFDAAVVDAAGVIGGPESKLMSPEAVIEWLMQFGPTVVAVDSPRCTAPPGEASRVCERQLASSVCGIRWTPDARRVAANGYYEWVRRGLELYAALESAGAGGEVIEVFPTASWTQWADRRGNRSRAAWSGAALGSLGLERVPRRRLSQDARDAIAAAVTARAFTHGRVQCFDEIVVPLEGLPA